MEKKKEEREEGVVVFPDKWDEEFFSPSWENTTGFFPEIEEDDFHLPEQGA